MNTAANKIAEVLAKFGEPVAGNVWNVQGQPVIYHKALERIAAQAQIQFGLPHILRCERDEAVILVIGAMGEPDTPTYREEWSIGEALIGVNYRVSGKQAAYVWAMAEKRAKDRVILKLIELHGLLYSEEEADEFQNTSPPEPARGDDGDPPNAPPKPQRVPAAPAKRPWKDVPAPQQAGILSEKPEFWRFLGEVKNAGVIETADDAAWCIREFCKVQSRADIVPGSKAHGWWLKLSGEYANWLKTEGLDEAGEVA